MKTPPVVTIRLCAETRAPTIIKLCSRSAPLLTLLYALTFARWSRQPVPAARRFRRESSDRGRSRLLSRGYRWFESISLQRGVRCEPDFIDHVGADALTSLDDAAVAVEHRKVFPDYA